MGILIFLLTLLVTIDHFVKYRPSGMVFYKNAHQFSIIVAVDGTHPHLEKLMEHAKVSKHQFIFVSINGILPKDSDENLEILEIDVDSNTEDYIRRTPLLSHAYVEGYKHAKHEFLLFMDSYQRLDNYKTIDHMANNLVEHQIYTVKETMPLRSNKEGYKLFLDVLRDMNLSDEMINYSFYAVKRNTYELTGCHENVYREPSDFVETVAKKNVNIVHINHARTICRGEDEETFKTYMSNWFTDFKSRKDIPGLRRMLLFLLAYHVFYAFILLDMIVNEVLIHYFLLLALTPAMFFMAIRAYTRHSALNYVLLPFYMLYFDFVLITGGIKRLFFKLKARKNAPNEEQDHEDLLP